MNKFFIIIFFPIFLFSIEIPQMILIKKGSFYLGGKINTNTFVTFKNDYYIGKYETTFKEYDEFCDDTNRIKPNDEGWGRGTRPVINVSLNDALEYVKWLSLKTGDVYKIPNESQWEYAANGNNLGDYNFGNNLKKICEYANIADESSYFKWKSKFCNDGFKFTAPVGSFKPNEFGLYDTHGNVSEMCIDGNYRISSVKKDGTATINTDTGKVTKSSSWVVSAKRQKITARYWERPWLSGFDLGFRVIKEVKEVKNVK